ncbi:hypothetical protein C8R47DRAFT_1205051 [Mycena vitilis]|nr:hypothetical protein C8R47DRAFT_1205051 [Mycena vitilis]
MPVITLEQLERQSLFFLPGMPVPAIADVDQYPGFWLKPKNDTTQPSLDWDPCSARVFTPVAWNRDEHENETVWTLKDAMPERDGIYVDSHQRDAASLPNTQVRTHECLAHALFDHWIRCQVSHEHCLQANELRRAEAKRYPGHVALDDESVEYMGMGWRARAFFAGEGTVDRLLSVSSRAVFEAHPDSDSD